jgi:conjugative relaxase-like TrwC/TraI family protein
VTPIRVAEQVEYRLSENCGCDAPADAQVEYRLGETSDLRWIGEGVRELGLVPGEAVDPDAARAMMDGRDWRTGEQLVRRKRVLDPRGKVPAGVLVAAIKTAAVADGISVADFLGTPALTTRLARAERGLDPARDGEAHALPVADAERLATAAGLSLTQLYGEDVVSEARRFSGHHVDVGLRGFDLVLDIPKSLSAAYALAPSELAAAMDEDWVAVVREAVAEGLEPWCAYGMAGHHGDGERAQRIATSGLLGWTTVHRSARPVDGGPGDPHLHVHISLAHMARCVDGKWRTIAAGGEDLHRHARLINEIAEAKLRGRWIEKYGARFEQSTTTGAWELAGIDERVRTVFSRRHEQILAVAGEGASRDQQKAAARISAEAKTQDETDSRASWRTRAARALEEGRDLAQGEAAVDAMVRAALPGWDGPGPDRTGGTGGPVLPTPEQIAARIWNPEHGLTASKKTVSRTHVLAAVTAAMPYLTSVHQLEALADQVLAVDGHAVRLQDSNRHHQVHRERYTHTAIVGAETVSIERAVDGIGAGWAQVTREAAELTISAAEVAQGWTYSPQQRAVVMRLMCDGHAVDAVLGVAGAGKTTIMAAARAGWEAAGLTVAGASTAAVAAANLVAEAGIDSRTIAAWTQDINGGRGLADVAVLVIDEGAMVDDRAFATLLRHAKTTGTKVVTVGDPMQLRAVGVGGAFARVHELVDGLALDENRRQRDPIERTVLSTWRDGRRTEALRTLAAHGHVHAGDTSVDALTAMLTAWNTARRAWSDRPHDQVENLLLLAARRADVATLNHAAHQALWRAGELGTGHVFDAPGAAYGIEFCVGDLVRVTRNDYRSRIGQADVLNGYRGIVRDIDLERGVLVQWRRPNRDGGHVLQETWMSPAHIREGRLTHGYALTIGSAQGLTAERTLAYGLHADAHSLYPALSRARSRTDLYLPLQELEDDPTRIRLGAVRSDAERLDRAVAAYGRVLEPETGDVMVTDELTAASAALDEQHQVLTDHQRRTAAARLRSTTVTRPRRPADDVDQAQREARQAGAPAPRDEAVVAAVDDEDRFTARQAQIAALRARYTGPDAPVLDENAGQRLAESLAGAQPSTEPTPVPDWRTRPYGHVPTSDLDEQARESDRAAREATDKARKLTEQATSLSAVLDTDQAPAHRRTASWETKLQGAEDLLKRARENEEKAGAIERRISEMYEWNRKEWSTEQKVRARAGLKRTALTLQRGRLLEDADALAQRIADRTEQIEQLRQHARQLVNEAREARQSATSTVQMLRGATNYVTPLSEQLAALRAELPARYQRAAQLDREKHISLTRQADTERETAGRETKRAAGLRTEADLRARLTPEQNATETNQRAAAALQAQAKQHAATVARAAQYERDRPPPERTGPSPNAGRGRRV